MQYRLDVLAAAAPLLPVQVMVVNPSQQVPRLRNGEVVTDGPNGTPEPPPNDNGGSGAPSGS
eukprot:7299875-Heterocapsa_arctica.AAC.1